MKTIDKQNQSMNGKIMPIFMGVVFTILITMILGALSSYFGGFTSTGSAIDNVQARTTVSERFTIPVIIHLFTAIPSVFLGGYLLWRKKGDALHKNLGKIWSAMMLITATATIWIGAPGSGIAGSGFSFIHIFTVMTFISIPLAIWSIKRGDVEGHYKAMRGLYIGLLLAGLFSFLPGRIMHILAFDWI